MPNVSKLKVAKQAQKKGQTQIGEVAKEIKEAIDYIYTHR
jgi:hypothetical protein